MWAGWGRYERVPNDEHDVTKTRTEKRTGAGDRVKVRVWRRVPVRWVGPAAARRRPDPTVRPRCRRSPDVRLQGTVRTNAKGERLVTLFLVNGQSEPETNKDEAWLFQPEIVVRAPEAVEDRPVFRRRPSNDRRGRRRARPAGADLSRPRRVRGRAGVAVHAETPPDDPTRAIEVRTEVIPRLRSAP